MTKPTLDKVLVANDNLLGIDVALVKAAKIERYSGAAIEVAQVIYDTVAEEPSAMLADEQKAVLVEGLKAAERRALERLIETYRDQVANIDTHVIWNKNTTDGIIGALKNVDILIKPVSHHTPLVDRLQAPLDWSLMRNAQCPVLISKQDWSSTSCLVAAIDAADTDHTGLNRQILASANQLSQILGAELHVICAYPSLGQTPGELQVAMDYEGIKVDMRRARGELINKLAEDLDVDIAELHLVEGKPGVVIPETANSLGAAVTVLGTAARRGLSQLLIGNTAEKIISAIEGDILTVREPAG